MDTNFNVESVIEILNLERAKSGEFSIIDKGFEILPKEYHDFWQWLFDDRVFFEHDGLSRISGFAPSEEVQNNKRILYEYVKGSAIGAVWELPELRFYQEVPTRSYEECRKEVAVLVEQKQEEAWLQLCEWSKGFRKFICKPVSEFFLRTRSKKELKLFFRSIDYRILERALIIYTHDARMMVLCCYSDRIKREVLEKMKEYSKAGTLSLTECVEAESIIHKAIEKYWKPEIGGSLEEYMQERHAIVDKVRKVSGEKYFMIPHHFSVKKCEGGIILTIKPMNIDFEGMTHAYDIDWKYPITKYAFILYKYVLEAQGKVHIDIEGKRELPVYDFGDSRKQEDYFLFLYRLMKLEKCYSCIVLSDIIEKAVRAFEQNLTSLKGTEEAFVRRSYKRAFGNTIREYRNPANYYDKIRESISNSGRLSDVLKNVTEEAWRCEDINREFKINLYRGDYLSKKRCCNMDALDFWAIHKDTFYALNLYHNNYDSVIDMAFFYANYLGDLLEGGLFENAGLTDDEMCNVKDAVLVVLMHEQQDNIFFKDWMEYSENIVEKVKIMWRKIYV